MFQAIHDAIARRDSGQALSLAEQAVAEQPEAADAHHALALARQAGGDLAGALDALQHAIGLAPDRADLHVARAALALARRDRSTAASALRDAIGQDPNKLSAYVMAAHLELASGRLDEAEKQLKLAQRIQAEHPGVLTVEGNLALARGDHGKAVRLLTLASDRAPTDPMALASLGMAFLHGGNAAFAEQALRRAVELQPKEISLRWGLVEALARQQRDEDVLTELSAILELVPDSGRAHALAVQAHLNLDHADAAQGAAQRWLGSRRLDWNEIDALAGYFLRAGHAERVAPMFDAQLGVDPSHEALWQFRHSMVAHEPQAAQDVRRRWQIAMPDSAALLGVQSVDAEQQDQLERAEQLADAALAAQPGLLAPLMVKFHALLRRDPEQLVPYAEDVAKRSAAPFGRRLALVWQGLAQDKLGRHAEAAACWRRAARITLSSPPYPAVQAWRASETAEPVPVCLLWGAPGSRVSEVVGMLRQTAGLHLLDDRFGRGPRPDGLWPPRQDEQVVDAGGWQRFVQAYGVDPQAAVDALPHWDGRTDEALGRARLVAVVGDPRDLFLNALVFGGAQPWSTPEVDALAAWLVEVLTALSDRRDAWPEQTLLLDAGHLAQEPTRAAASLQAFLGLGSSPPVESLQAARVGPGGAPLCFASGTWRHYADAFAQPFAQLEPVAARLGYAS